MKENQIGAVAPKKLGREFWLELVGDTLKRSLCNDEHEMIASAYERSCASHRLDPGIIVDMIFPQIRSVDGKGYLEVQCSSLAVDNYAYDVEDKDVTWDVAVTSGLIPTKGGVK